MDLVARLIAACVVLFSLCGPAMAISFVPSQPVTSWRCQNPANSVWSYSTSQTGACELVAQAQTNTRITGGYKVVETFTLKSCPTATSCKFNKQTVSTCYPGPGGCASPGTSNVETSATAQNMGTVISCPANTTPLGTVCECNTGTKPSADGQACVAHDCPNAGTYSPVTQPDQLVPNAGDNQCAGGCEFKPSAWKSGPDGKIWATWPFTATGKSCGGAKATTDPKASTGELNSQNPAPIACASNQCPGQVNGANVCVACSGTKVDGPSTAASGTTPTNDTSGAIKGEQKSTECNGTTCTTTTTYKDANGSTIGTKSETKDQKSFCQENPTLQICKEARWTGACSAGFSCEGDAVQCAMSKEVHTRNCQLYQENGLSEVGEAALNAGAVPDGHPGKNPDEKNFSTMFKPTMSAASCLLDKTVTVMGKTVTLPFSKLCDPLRWMGWIAYAFALLHCGFFLARKF